MKNEQKNGKVIGILGPAGVGKNYVIKQMIDRKIARFEYLPRVTTRTRRPTDDQEGVIPVSEAEFDMYAPSLISVHAPFNDFRKYGWYVGDADQKLQDGVHLITDPNVDHLAGFNERFKQQLLLIGITGDSDYLRYNLEQRILMDKPTITESEQYDIQKRIHHGEQYSQRIASAYRDGLIHHHIEANWDTRPQLVDMVVNMLHNEGLIKGEGALQDKELSYMPLAYRV